jgi:hypothetical protein
MKLEPLAFYKSFNIPGMKLEPDKTTAIKSCTLCDLLDEQGRLPSKTPLSPDENALLAPARRPALHFLWKIHIQGHLSSISKRSNASGQKLQKDKTV